MSEDSRKDPTLSNGPGHKVDKDPPASSTPPEQRDEPGMEERKRGDLGGAPGPRTKDVDVMHRFNDEAA